jgi:hypothetical protein
MATQLFHCSTSPSFYQASGEYLSRQHGLHITDLGLVSYSIGIFNAVFHLASSTRSKEISLRGVVNGILLAAGFTVIQFVQLHVLPFAQLCRYCHLLSFTIIRFTDTSPSFNSYQLPPYGF